MGFAESGRATAGVFAEGARKVMPIAKARLCRDLLDGRIGKKQQPSRFFEARFVDINGGRLSHLGFETI